MFTSTSFHIKIINNTYGNYNEIFNGNYGFMRDSGKYNDQNIYDQLYWMLSTNYFCWKKNDTT